MNLLACFFFLLAVLFYCFARKRLQKHIKKRCWLSYLLFLLAVVFGVFSILSKENTAVLPIIILLVEIFFIRSEQTRFRESLCYVAPFILVPVAGLVFYAIDMFYAVELNKPLAVFFLSAPDDSGRLIVVEHPESLRLRYLQTQFIVVWQYVALFFWPLNQALDYCYPLVSDLINWKSLFGFLGVSVSLMASWIIRRKSPLIAFGLLWFFLLLVVESSVIPLDPFFEHRLYLPIVGLILIVLSALKRLFNEKIASSILFVAVVALSILTWQRNELWNDPIELWKDNVRVTPFAYRPWLNLGSSYSKIGDMENAKAALMRGLELNPNSARGHVNLGSALDELGEKKLAIAHYQKALIIGGDNFRAAFNLGVLYEKAKEYDQAKRYYVLAIKFNPHSYKGYLGLGAALYYQGKLKEALKQFESAKRYGPNVPDVVYSYASVALELGQLDRARKYLPHLKRLNAELYRNLLEEINAFTGRSIN
jgi:tetratricopeptide (TPR) repeat protein